MKEYKERGVHHRIDGPAVVFSMSGGGFTLDGPVLYFLRPSRSGSGVMDCEVQVFFLYGVQLDAYTHKVLTHTNYRERLIELMKMRPGNDHVHMLLSEIDPQLADSVRAAALLI